MLVKFESIFKSFLNAFKIASRQFKQQPAYEVINVSTCPKRGHHILEIKVTGKSQSISYLAEEIVVDNTFLMGFPPSDIRTITYLATCDRYEEMLREEKIRKNYEIIRSNNIKGEKVVHLRHKETNENLVICLSNFSDQNLIDNLTSHDAYYLGFLTGQEQTWKDCVRLKVITKTDSE